MKNTFLKIFLLTFLLGCLPVFAFAVDVEPKLNVKIGNADLEFSTPSNCGSGEVCNVGWIGEYVAVLYQYGVGVAGFLAVLMIMIGGFIWLTSAGSPDRISQAKDFISSALLGLLLALFSFVILFTVNPRLVNLEAVNILTPEETTSSGDSIYYTQDSDGAAAGQSLGGGGGVVVGSGGTEPVRQPLSPSTNASAGARASYYLDNYNSDGQAWQTSHVRNDGTRHDPSEPGYEANIYDFHYEPNGELTQHILNNGERLTGSDAPTWGTAYRMDDGSVWVKEPGGSTGYHWHVEFPSPGWTWVANR